MASTNLEIVISATDRFSGTANKVIGSLNRMDTAAGRVGKGFGQLGAGIARAGLIIGTAAGTGLVGIAKHTIGWESALAGVNKTMDLTDTELQAMGASIRKLALEIPLGTSEIAGLVEQAGALGIAKEDVVGFAEVAATMGVTTNVAADQAATSLGVMSNLLGLTGQDFERFGSTLVDLGNKGASTEAQILAVAERAAGGASTIGLATDELLGFASAVANIGMEPEAGGSQLQTFFLTAQKHIAASGDELRIWARTAKMSARDFARTFEADPAAALESFVEGLSKLDKNARITVLDELGLDNIRMSRMLLGLAEAEKKTDNLSNSLNVSAEAWRANTAMAEEADKRYGTVQSKLALLKNQFLEGALVIGEGFLPALGRVADKLKTILGDEKTRGQLTQFGKDIGKFLDDIDWEDVISGARSFVGLLKDAASFAAGILEVLNKLPTEVKAAGLGLIGLNKLSGGLVGQGLGNIAGGIGETLARSAGSKLPGVGKLFAQPVFVTNWPMGGLGGGPVGGGPGGGIKGLLKSALTIAIPATVLVGALAAVQGEINKGHQSQADANSARAQEIAGKSTPELRAAIDALKGLPDTLDPLQRAMFDLNANGVKTHNEDLISFLETELAKRERPVNDAALQEQRQGERSVTQSIDKARVATEAGNRAAQRHADRLAGKAEAGLAAQREGERAITSSVDEVASAQALAAGQAVIAEVTRSVQAVQAISQQMRTADGVVQTKNAVNNARSGIISAIRANRPIVNVDVSATTVVRTSVVQERAGRQSGSRGQGRTAS